VHLRDVLSVVNAWSHLSATHWKNVSIGAGIYPAASGHKPVFSEKALAALSLHEGQRRLIVSDKKTRGRYYLLGL